MTADEFLETAPLFTRVDLVRFHQPESITRTCQHPKCERETTWQIKSSAQHDLFVNEVQHIHHALYTCVRCDKSSVIVFYQLLGWSEDKESTPNQYGKRSWRHTGVWKIGQLPGPDIAIAPALAKQLGSTAQHYRNAIITRQHGLGIAAMAYMRRVVDEKTDALIDIMADLARTHQTPESDVTLLLEAKTETRYEQKLERAAALIPQALRPGGINPLGQLYNQLSIGLHGKSDAECVAIFDDLRADFEYVFRNLHNEMQERQQFVKRMTARAGNG